MTIYHVTVYDHALHIYVTVHNHVTIHLLQILTIKSNYNVYSILTQLISKLIQIALIRFALCEFIH